MNLTMSRMDVDEVRIAPNRIRKSLGNLDALVKSIESKGQLHPIIIDAKNTLVSGERRLEACRVLGIPVLAVRREDLSDADMTEIEVLENAARLDFSWLELVAAVNRLHALKIEQHGGVGMGRPVTGGNKGWGYADTGALLGRSAESIRLDVKLWEYIQDYPELRDLSKKSEAYKRMRDIAEDAALTELARRAQTPAGGETQEKQASIPSEEIVQQIMDLKDLSDEEKKVALDLLASKDTVSEEDGTVEETVDAVQKKIEADLGDAKTIVSRFFVKGDAFELMQKFPDEHFDVIITDPPYGIDVNKTVAKNYIGVFDDKASWIHNHMESLLRECWRMMKKDSHMYLFFAIGFYSHIMQLCQDIGFEPDVVPIIWVKGSYSGKSGDPIKYPGRAYEMILYLRKGNMPLAQRGMPNVIVDNPVHGFDKIHPTQKPVSVINNLLIRSSHPGCRVLDPMAGSGAVVEAGMKRGIPTYGIELDETYHARGLDKIAKTFKQLSLLQLKLVLKELDYEF